MYFNINSFDLSVSAAYSNKNEINWGWVRYKKQTLTVETFANLVKKGCCFCHCFRTVGETFGVKEKTDANFQKAHCVFVDIDDSEIEMKEFISRLTKIPTVYYTTPNNYTAKSNYLFRFRLVYLFDKAIESVEDYTSMYFAIMQSISKDIPTFKSKDDCGKKASQQFGGNAKDDCELYTNMVSYSVVDFPIKNNNASLSFSILSLNGNEGKADTIQTSVEIADKEFISDINTLKPSDLITKYRLKYEYFDHSPITFQDGYALLGEDYYEIYRIWGITTFEKNNGEIVKFSHTKRVRDGQHRRKKLYIAALIRKQILHSITYEHLLYNLICEREWYFDNSDKQLTNRTLSDIASRVVQTPIEKICLKSHNKRKFVIDKAYCREHGITPNEMKRYVEKRLHDEAISKVYDCSRSVKENLEQLHEYGIMFGKSTLYRWCKENGISTSPQRRQKRRTKDLNVCYSYYDRSTTIKREKRIEAAA